MDLNKFDKVLTLVFLVLAAAAVACYFLFNDDRTVFLYCGGAAVCVRLTQYLLKYIQ